MRTLYVVWKMMDGALRSDTITMEGKINHYTVTRAIRNELDYDDRYEFKKLISWQVEEKFTTEEMEEFINNNNF